jgi:hypothetical protein
MEVVAARDDEARRNLFKKSIESVEAVRRTSDPAEPVRRTPDPAEPVRDTSGVVVKPDRGQLSNESGAADEAGVLSREVIGVIMEIGLNEGDRGSYFGCT